MPVTKRLEPGLIAPSSAGGPRSFLGGPLWDVSLVQRLWVAKYSDRLSACPLPFGEVDLRGPRGLSLRRVGRGDALRSRS